MSDAADQRRLFEARLRNDLVAFVHRVFQEINPGRKFEPSWHHEAVAYYLDRTAVNGDLSRLVINMPPRSLKSEIVSIALPAFLLGRDPTRRIIAVSYNQDLAADFSRKTRQVMQSDWYCRLFPSTRIVGRGAETAFYTTRGGSRLATSVEGTLTGRGADLILIDDPQKASDAFSQTRRDSLYQWATETLFTRLDDKRVGAIVLVQQRLHEEDLSGKLLKTGGWLHLSLPATAVADEDICLGRSPLRFHHRRVGDLLNPVREPPPVLDQLRRDMGLAMYQAQYQQDPLPPDGDLIKIDWFNRYEALPAYERLIMSIDTASKPGQHNDYSVIAFWYVDDGRYYLDYVWRQKVVYPDLKRMVMAFADERQPAKILIEDKGIGIGLIQDLEREANYYPVLAYNPGQYDKETRMKVQAAKIERGRVWLPAAAPWLDAFIDEVRRFPNAPHDDQIDAMSQFLDFVSTPAPSLIGFR